MNSISFFLCLREWLRGRPTGRPRLERIESYYRCRCPSFTPEMLTYRVSASADAIRKATETNTANTTETANAAYRRSFADFSGVNDAAFSVTETAGPWDGPAYWLNALVRSLTRPIKLRIGIAARVLLEISFRSLLLLRQKSGLPGLNERKRMASDVSYVSSSEHDGKAR